MQNIKGPASNKNKDDLDDMMDQIYNDLDDLQKNS